MCSTSNYSLLKKQIRFFIFSNFKSIIITKIILYLKITMCEIYNQLKLKFSFDILKIQIINYYECDYINILFIF